MGDLPDSAAETIRRPQPGELWSLWDMLELKLGRLLELHERLTIKRGMFERGEKELRRGDAQQAQFPAKDFKDLINELRELEKITFDAGLRNTHTSTVRFLEVLSGLGEVPAAPGMMAQIDVNGCETNRLHLMDITSRVRDECRDRLYYQLEPDAADLLDDKAVHFGAGVEAAFPLAIEDIAESAACLALGRYAASVFHQMRAAEAAVFVVAGELKVERINAKGQHQSWGQLLPSIDTAIKAITDQSWKDKWSKVQTLIYATNRAWRIDISHGESDLKPKTTYTQKEAETCFGATRAFMGNMAEVTLAWRIFKSASP